jgi:pilus assembly protein CpaB
MLALVMGGATTFLFFQYVQQYEVKEAMVTNTANVVVAKDVIAINELITLEMLEVVEVAESHLHQSAVKDPEQIIGQFATTMIEKGEILLTHRTKSIKDEKMLVSRKVTNGYQAVSVGADFVRTVSNLIEPEDFVDVILTEVNESTGIKIITSEKIFSNVRVLAVGRKIAPPVSEEEAYIEYNSVTLEIKSDEAVKLVNASEKGTLHFTLHSSIVEEDK